MDIKEIANPDLSSFYIIIGTLIVMNFGSIITMLITAGRVIWFIAKIDAQVKENTKDIDKAHEMIRDINRSVKNV